MRANEFAEQGFKSFQKGDAHLRVIQRVEGDGQGGHEALIHHSALARMQRGLDGLCGSNTHSFRVYVFGASGGRKCQDRVRDNGVASAVLVFCHELTRRPEQYICLLRRS
jgi:hypothetical protein